MLGIAFIPRFTIDLNPNYNLPKLTVSFNLYDATPELIEQEATSPLENALSQISNIKKIYSISGQDNGTIEITFDNNVDLDFKKFEVSSIVRQLYPKLNQEITYPIVEQRSQEDESRKALLLYRVNSSLTPFQIKKYTEDLFITSISQIKGVKEAAVTGAENLQINIDYDYEKLKLYGLSVSAIANAIQEEFISFYPGSVVLSVGQTLLVKAEHSFNNLTDLENLLLPAAGHSIRLKDVARIYIEEGKPHSYFRINGLNSIALAVYADEGVNRLLLGDQIKKKVSESGAHLPEGYRLELDYDDTKFLSKEIQKNYIRSGLSIFILLLFILIAYRNWRHLLILFTGIIINLLLTALAAYMLDIAIHLYTIAGITISFGMMVDNAIVMMDELDKRNQKNIFKAILGATLTTVMALLLVLFLPEDERQNLTEFCMIVAVALTSSILVAIFYVPAVYHLIFKNDIIKRSRFTFRKQRRHVWIFSIYTRFILFIARYRKTFIALVILAFGLPVFLLPTKWEGQEWYNQTIGSDMYQEKIRTITDPLLGGSLRLFIRNVYERSGYRDAQRTQLYINAELPQGNTLEEMNRVMIRVEDYLKTVEGIDKYILRVQSGQDASISILFKEQFENGSLPYQLKGRLIARSLDWGGVDWNIYGVGQGFSNGVGDNLPSFRVQMMGYNYNELATQADKLAGKLLLHKRIQKVNTNERLSWDEKSTERFVLDIDRQRAGAASINPATVASAIRDKALNENPQLALQKQNERMPVVIKSYLGNTLSAYQVLEEGITTNAKVIKLSQIAGIKHEKTSGSIHKQNRQYIRVVAFDYYGSSKFGDEFLDKSLAEMKLEMPVGYSTEKISWRWNWNKTKRQYSLLLLLVVGIYFICTILFENFRQPFYIITSIPVSFIGLFLTFSQFDFYFDQGGYAAFILLGGLVVNASIFILHDFNNTTYKNHNRAVIKAVTGKFKPITLTVLSTCLGLIPFVMGGQNEIFWFALAVGTMGGLVFSLFAVFILLPVVVIKRSK